MRLVFLLQAENELKERKTSVPYYLYCILLIQSRPEVENQVVALRPKKKDKNPIKSFKQSNYSSSLPVHQ